MQKFFCENGDTPLSNVNNTDRLIAVIRNYCSQHNNRTINSVFNDSINEFVKLDDELMAEKLTVAGITESAMRVMAKCLILILTVDPDINDELIIDYIKNKCKDWSDV